MQDEGIELFVEFVELAGGLVYTVAEVGEELGVSVGEVKALLASGKRKARLMVGELGMAKEVRSLLAG